jgi:hypothetical protein
MATKFVQIREIEEATPRETKRLAAIEAEMKQIQSAMMQEPGLTSTLLPVLRQRQKERSKLIGQPNVIRESVDMNVILNFLNGTQTNESRIRLKDLARQSISSIRLKKIESTNWHVMVTGTITTTDQKTIPFRYAYNTRRVGFILCDGSQQATYSGRPNEDKFPVPVKANTITAEVKAELQKLPKRRDHEKSK